MKYIELAITRTQSTMIVVAVPDDFETDTAMRWSMKPLLQSMLDKHREWQTDGVYNGNFEIESAGDACSDDSECQFDPATDEADVTLTAEQIAATLVLPRKVK